MISLGVNYFPIIRTGFVAQYGSRVGFLQRLTSVGIKELHSLKTSPQSGEKVVEATEVSADLY